jgi:DNA-binding FadR family transcriptional regulator
LNDPLFRKQARPAGKLAEGVAAKIEREIIERGWPVGEVLGSEAALTHRYGVSRAVFREAVRLLESDRVARMRPGPNGGLMVTAPESESVAHAMALYLSFARVSVGQLLDIRGLFEAHAAELAALNATDDGRTELRALLADERQKVEGDWRVAKEFHLLVARMSGNPAVHLIAQCLVMLTEQQTTPARSRRATAKRVHDIHTRVGEAILAGDAPLARSLMLGHIHALDPWLGETGKAAVSAPA